MFVTKYRHPVLTGKVKDVVYERIHYVADQRGFHILEINGETILKKYYWKPYFWSDSYFISSVSENSLHTIKQYIRNQGKR